MTTYSDWISHSDWDKEHPWHLIGDLATAMNLPHSMSNHEVGREVRKRLPNIKFVGDHEMSCAYFYAKRRSTLEKVAEVLEEMHQDARKPIWER